MTSLVKHSSYDTQLSDSRVAAVEVRSHSYAQDEISDALARAARALDWAEESRGPLGGVIASGARVLVKPNLVMHENQGPWGMDPLVTHASIIRAVTEAALRAGASEVLVGDAPLQGCDFDQLLSATGLGDWAEELKQREPRFKGIGDFRRTTCVFIDGVRVASEDQVPEDQFVLFDLGGESLLEPISDNQNSFRVTCYDPRLMAKTHTVGRHRYLVSKNVIDADVVINLPKLKTHKKAGVTCALKNLIGINGNKEFLPHHRVGGSKTGGDCYPGGSLVKRALEYTLDRQNQSSSFAMGRVWGGAATQLNRVSRLMGDRLEVEGSWSGNDTIWRTCLDLNRILLYGRSDASLADTPQRQVLHITDAVIAGQGDGPLSPQPLGLGLILAGRSAAAMDWVGARLLGYYPERITVAREAFSPFRWPLASFSPNDVMLAGDLGTGDANELLEEREIVTTIIYPLGWRDAARQSDV